MVHKVFLMPKDETRKLTFWDRYGLIIGTISVLLAIIGFLIQIVNQRSDNEKENNIINTNNRGAIGVTTHNQKNTTNSIEVHDSINNEKEPNDSTKYIINHTFRNLSGKRKMIISIVKDNEHFDEPASLIIKKASSRKGYNSTASFFSNSFYEEKLGNQLMLGNLGLVKRLNLSAQADYLLIGSYSETFGNDKQGDIDMSVIHLSYTFNLINLKDLSEKILQSTINNNGFSKLDARNNALNSLYEDIQSKL